MRDENNEEMKIYKFEIQFLSYSIKDGSEFIMKIYDYFLAYNEDIAYGMLKKKKETSEYYARIWPKITDIYVYPTELIGWDLGITFVKHIYHNDHPQPSLFDLSGEYKQ